MIKWGSLFYATGWLIINYEILADHGHYVDEYTVIKEIAVQTGKVLILVFAIIVVFNLGLNWTFALAALASLFINFL